jgi:cytochrome b involved in lipid metabolism
MEGGLQMVDDLLKNPISLTTTKLTKTLLKKEGSQKTADVELPIITKNELKKHTTKESLWAYITDPHTGLDYVYDFTDWIDKHPGGASHIISIGGKDATKKFYGQKAHPIEKIEKVIFPKYRIGILE